MRIPPLYEEATWQRFFAGMFIGAVLSWFVFLFLFGELQEKQLKKIVNQTTQIKDLEETNQVLEKDYQELNEKNQKQLMIREIVIHLTNEKQLKLDTFTSYELKNSAKGELKHLINNNIETVAENKELVMKAIENKIFKVDDQNFKLKIEHLYLFTKLELNLKVEKVT